MHREERSWSGGMEDGISGSKNSVLAAGCVCGGGWMVVCMYVNVNVYVWVCM